MFGLTELSDFRIRFEALDPKIGWDISETAAEIAKRIRKYMFIMTLASVLTGLAVCTFTLSVGLDLAIAWGVISFVLNYIPFIGPLVAVALPVLFATAQFESWKVAVFIFGGLYAIQFLIGNYLEPVIAGKALAISPLAMLVAFFSGLSSGGFPVRLSESPLPSHFSPSVSRIHLVGGSQDCCQLLARLEAICDFWIMCRRANTANYKV